MKGVLAKRKVKTAKLSFVRCATRMFLEKGYNATSPKQIVEALDTGTGNLTYYFPTKEHLLAVLVDLLCAFQWNMMEQEVNESLDSLMAISLELATIIAVCEEDLVAKDFYTSAYAGPMCLDIIRRNDTARAKAVFAPYCPGWTDEQFVAAASLVSGLEYGVLMTAGDPVSLETRIASTINAILKIYQIPEEIRKANIERVLEMDYRAIARRVLVEFKRFVDQSNEQAWENLFKQAI